MVWEMHFARGHALFQPRHLGWNAASSCFPLAGDTPGPKTGTRSGGGCQKMSQLQGAADELVSGKFGLVTDDHWHSCQIMSNLNQCKFKSGMQMISILSSLVRSASGRKLLARR